MVFTYKALETFLWLAAKFLVTKCLVAKSPVAKHSVGKCPGAKKTYLSQFPQIKVSTALCCLSRSSTIQVKLYCCVSHVAYCHQAQKVEWFAICCWYPSLSDVLLFLISKSNVVIINLFSLSSYFFLCRSLPDNRSPLRLSAGKKGKTERPQTSWFVGQ